MFSLPVTDDVILIVPFSGIAVHQIINGGVGSVLPYGLQRVILDGIFTVGRAQLSEYLLNESNPLGSVRLARLRSIFEEGKSLQLQFPAEDLGFRYHISSTQYLVVLLHLRLLKYLPKKFKIIEMGFNPVLKSQS